MQNLDVLNVKGNHLSSLPQELSELEILSVVNIANNDFKELPEVLT
ncbi:hypothetical protein Q2T40_16495 [Winogradskyella maritima]|uniref:Leucine rich repeat (LRR) protein n=1 Tax=Winogradskyella maritima TaxID=1517766 RepID=A0ABV8AEX0_9FLAO|nr:hypothetical protein [Winogradskyella maritima]